LLIPGLAAHAAGPLKVNGSTTVNLVAAEAAEILRAERKVSITVDTQGGSSGGIGRRRRNGRRRNVSKPVADEDRRKYPKVTFVETRIGQDAVALVVSADVWDGGVKALTREQVKALYESRVTNWRQVGGPDRRVVFFNKEPGRGTWEVFVHWVYGSAKKAPEVSLPEVGGNEETRTKVASTKGAITAARRAGPKATPRCGPFRSSSTTGRSYRPRREHRVEEVPDVALLVPRDERRAEGRGEGVHRFRALGAGPGAGEKTRLSEARGPEVNGHA
jgi:hypothetical protein